MSDVDALRKAGARTRADCRICGSAEVSPFIRHESLPVAGMYLSANDIEPEPLFPLTVGFCRSCGLVQLGEVIPAEFYSSYRFTGSGSSSYRTHVEQVADALVDEWGLDRKRIVEIGCNDGYLLRMLKERGRNKVFGYEPAVDLAQSCERQGIDVAAELFGPTTIGLCPLAPVDAVIFRHVLEHIDDVHAFLGAVRSILRGPGSLVVIEVPDMGAILGNRLYSNFYHEHLSYFSRDSLSALLAQHGFVPRIWKRVPIHGGSLLVVCEASGAHTDAAVVPDRQVTFADCEEFAGASRRYFDSVGSFVRNERRRKVVLAGYGAAHRTVVTCSLAGLGSDDVAFLVDRNPYLHGFVVPGARIPIYGPARLSESPPDALVLFATSFEEEIVREQQAFARDGGRFVSISAEPKFI